MTLTLVWFQDKCLMIFKYLGAYCDQKIHRLIMFNSVKFHLVVNKPFKLSGDQWRILQ